MKYLITLLLFSLSLMSCDMTFQCSSKESFLNSFERFHKDLEKHHNDLTEADWTEVDEEFKSFVDNCYEKYKSDLSLKEKIDFWKNTLSYHLYRGKPLEELALEMDLEKELNDLGLQGKKELEDFFKDEIKPELGEAIDEILNEVNNLGEQLKKWLDE